MNACYHSVKQAHLPPSPEFPLRVFFCTRPRPSGFEINEALFLYFDALLKPVQTSYTHVAHRPARSSVPIGF